MRWIGGGSGGGKSTIATLLADERGLQLYRTDDTIRDHVARSNPIDHPLLHAFVAMDMDERWVNRSPTEMFRTFHFFHGEGFELIVEDLLALPTRPGVLVEGFRLLPRLVAPLLDTPDQAVWLLPTTGFRVAALETRGTTAAALSRTSDPARALDNLLARDALFTEQVEREAAGLGLRTIPVDLDSNVDVILDRIRAALAP